MSDVKRDDSGQRWVTARDTKIHDCSLGKYRLVITCSTNRYDYATENCKKYGGPVSFNRCNKCSDNLGTYPIYLEEKEVMKLPELKTYGDVRKFAESKGVSCKGKNAEEIRAELAALPDEKPAVVKKSSKSKPPPAPEPDEEDMDEDDEDEEDTSDDEEDGEELDLTAERIQAADLPQLQAWADEINETHGPDTISYTAATKIKGLRQLLVTFVETAGEESTPAEAVESNNNFERLFTFVVALAENVGFDTSPLVGNNTQTKPPPPCPDWLKPKAKVEVNVGQDEEDWQNAVVVDVNLEKGECNVTFENGGEGEEIPFDLVRKRARKSRKAA